jgi:hypothetical protein
MSVELAHPERIGATIRPGQRRQRPLLEVSMRVRPSPVLRGPIHLAVEYDGIAPASLERT